MSVFSHAHVRDNAGAGAGAGVAVAVETLLVSQFDEGVRSPMPAVPNTCKWESSKVQHGELSRCAEHAEANINSRDNSE